MGEEVDVEKDPIPNESSEMVDDASNTDDVVIDEILMVDEASPDAKSPTDDEIHSAYQIVEEFIKKKWNLKCARNK